MAIDDFGGAVLGKQVELIVADRHNNPDPVVSPSTAPIPICARGSATAIGRMRTIQLLATTPSNMSRTTVTVYMMFLLS